MCRLYGLYESIAVFGKMTDEGTARNMEEWKVIRMQCSVEKKQWEQELRKLWLLSFGDSKKYEDFYFRTVYNKNLVYGILDWKKRQAIGMLHLNPYICQIEESRKRLHYIVGVATDSGYRRQGVMRALLTTALQELYEDEAPFTYLMPANVSYYEPFSFVSVCEEEKYELSGKTSCCKPLPQILYVDYKELSVELSKEEWDIVNISISEWLKENYSVFPVHNREYFELLYQEKACQDGSLVFIFSGQEKTFLGCFAYGRNEDGVVVEQSVYQGMEEEEKRKGFEGYIKDYFADGSRIMMVRQFPYMIRIVDALSCMKLYGDCFLKYAENCVCIRLVDDNLQNNCGIYRFQLEKKGITVERMKETEVDLADVWQTASNPDNSIWRVEDMTIAELAGYIFQKEEKNVYFSEII